jgi:hypothetical protein
MAKAIVAPVPRFPVKKRTSIGGKHCPLNKSKRRSWKRYRGQGGV